MKWMLMNLLFSVLLTCSFSIHSTRGDQVAFGGYLWEAFSDNSHIYAEARKFCIESGGWPAEPKTKELNDYLTTLVSESSVENTKGHYIGLTKIKKQTIWRWSNGDEALWTNWKANAGGKGDNYLCAAILPNGQWNDVYCDTFNPDTTKSFACQWDLLPSSDSMKYDGYLWERFETLATFPEAQAACSARGGWPIEPRDKDINAELTKFLNSGSDYFIGLAYDTVDKKWYWRGHNKFSSDTYTNWDGSGEGSGAGGQICAMIREETGKWYDVICNSQRNIVCQTSLPTTRNMSDNYLLEVFDADGNYEDAKTLCTARGQWAVEPRSEELNAALTDILDSSYADGYFIGLTTKDGSTWTWGTGDTIETNDYEKWGDKEPNRPGLVSCTVTSPINGQWNDIDCDYAPRGFSCQSAGYCRLRPNPCKNGGTCISTATDTFICVCTDGNFGATCEDEYCDYTDHMQPCDHGTCVSNHLEEPFYTCDCEDGYYGYTCKVNHCQENPGICKNGGECVFQEESPFYGCNCTDTGHYGQNCIVEYCDYSEHAGTCENGAVCHSIPEEPPCFYECICTPEYEGTNCSEPEFHTNDNCEYHINNNQLRRTTFDLGMDFCNDINGSLFMGKTSSTHDFITKKMKDLYGGYQTKCWIGGRQSQTTNAWQWTDTTAVPLNGDNSQWKSGEPGETDECMQISGVDGDYKWVGDGCLAETGFICERPVVGMEPCGTNPCKNGYCMKTGCQWKCECAKGYFGETCEKLDLCNIPQSPCRNNGNCTIISDDPYYRCNCTSGYVGYNCTELELGNPTIVEVIPKDCSAEGILNVTWKSHEHATLVSHRVQAIPSISGEAKELDVSPSDSGLQMTLLGELVPVTEYTVIITVCPDLCVEELNDQKTAITGTGLPGAVVDPVVKQTNISSECKLSWTQPPSNIDEVEGYKVNVTDSVVYHPDGNQIPLTTETEIEPTTLEYFLTPEPNREYSFAIRAKSCAGYGPQTVANGKCVGGSSSPDLILTPDVIDESASSTRQIVIMFPDEDNGPISCLFVIVSFDVISDKESFDINDLRKVSSDATDGVSYKYLEYLALAIPRENITENTIYANLGDDSVSGCDVNEIKLSMRASNNYYEAQNWPLDVGSTYSFYVASSTPVRDAVTAFKTSDVQTLQNGEPLDGNNLWIIGVVFGVLAVIGAIVVGIYIMRKRQNKEGSRKNSTNETEGPYQQCELYESAGYDNVIVADGTNAPGDNIEEEHPYLTIPAHGYENVEPHDTED